MQNCASSINKIVRLVHNSQSCYKNPMVLNRVSMKVYYNDVCRSIWCLLLLMMMMMLCYLLQQVILALTAMMLLSVPTNVNGCTEQSCVVNQGTCLSRCRTLELLFTDNVAVHMCRTACRDNFVLCCRRAA